MRSPRPSARPHAGIPACTRRATSAAAAPTWLVALLAACGGGGGDAPTTPPGGGSSRLDRVTVTGVPTAAAPASAGDTVALTATATAGGAAVADAALAWQLADTSAAAFLTAGGPAPTLSTGNAATARVRLRKAGAVGVTVTATAAGATASTTATFTAGPARVAPALVRLALSPRTVSARYGVPTAVTATVTDATGAAADVAVTWAPIPHDGERFPGTAPVQVTVPTSVPAGSSPAPTRTAQVVGVYPTTTRVVATAQPTMPGGQPVSDTLTLRVLDRPAASLAANTFASAMLPGATQAVEVTAADSAGRATTAPDGLTFSSSNPAVATVDAAGQVTAVAAGQATITASAPAGQTVYGPQALSATVAVTVVATAPFAIDVRFVGGGASGAYRTQVERAAARAVDRWRTLVTQGGTATAVALAAGQCGAASPAVNETVPSLLVFVELTTFGTGANAAVASGPAAVAGPCVVRSGQTGLPVVGRVLVDTAKLVGQSDDGVATVMTHELGHVLGFGTLWQGPRAAALVSGLGTGDPRYLGQNGAAAWQAAGGAAVGGTGVPLEAVTGGHWRPASFGDELMLAAVDSPTGRAPLSAVTVGVLADFGYLVTPANADPYRVPSGASALRALAATAPKAEADVGLAPTLAVGADGRVHALLGADGAGRVAVPRVFGPHRSARTAAGGPLGEAR